ncbi:UNVERIFIED_CONTAM: hypothetical protein FKN15_040744, partial [Acipenser sinensis]
CSPCPAHHYSENWHWDEKCQYCTVVCKEKQNFQHECNSTHNRLCKCMEGYHLEIEFCIKHSSCRSGYGVKKPGTSEDDTVCERCPEGYYSNELSATKPCIKHTNCAELGLRTSSPGTATCDAVCDTNEKDLSFPYFHNQLVCYTGLPAYQLAMLMDSLPGQKVDGRNIEMVKKICNPKQQTIHLLKLWMHQNKDQDKIYNLIQDMNQCERAVSRCPGFKNLTLDHFNVVKESLPGNKVKEEDIRWIVKTCDPKQYIPQLLSLWKAQNADQDTANALSQSVKKLRSQKVPRKLLQSLRRIANIFNSSAIHRIYQKMFLEIIQGNITLCEEVVFQFISSQGLPAYQLAMLMDSLPGQKVDGRNIEMVKKICNPKQQTIHLLKLWMHQNKDQDKIYNLIQDMNQCERAVSRCPGFKNLTLDHFNVVKESLPGNKVKEEDIRWIVKTCDPKQYIPQLLSLWKAQNADQDTANALSQSVKKLRSQKVPRKLLQSLRRIANIFNSSAIHRIYQKMFLEIIQGSKCLKAKSLNE